MYEVMPKQIVFIMYAHVARSFVFSASCLSRNKSRSKSRSKSEILSAHDVQKSLFGMAPSGNDSNVLQTH